MTPHVGEMSRLTGKSIGQIKGNPVETALCYSKEHGVICVLKDAATVVCDHDNIYINTSGNCGMATGGSGDVLTGVIAGMMCAGFVMSVLQQHWLYIYMAVPVICAGKIKAHFQ